MQSWSERFALGDRAHALATLDDELTAFGTDALQCLRADLIAGSVRRGTWDGCVLSYRAGALGSVGCDSRGRTRNAFTVLWDSGRLTDREVLARVEAELDRRTSSYVGIGGRESHESAPKTG
jgi:hypothetical protein